MSRTRLPLATAIALTLALASPADSRAAGYVDSHGGQPAATSTSVNSQASALWQQILQMNLAAQPQAVINACQQLIRLKPTFYGAWYYTGLAAQQAGQASLVQTAYNRALKLLNAELTAHPNQQDLLEVKADLHFRTGRIQAAVSIREQMLRNADNLAAQKRQIIHLMALFQSPKLYPMHSRYLQVTRYRYPAAFDDCEVQEAEQSLLQRRRMNLASCLGRSQPQLASRQPQTATIASSARNTTTAVTSPTATVLGGSPDALQQRYRQSPTSSTAFAVAQALQQDGRIEELRPWIERALPEQLPAAAGLGMIEQAVHAGHTTLARMLGARMLERNRYTRGEFLDLNRLMIKNEQRAGHKAGEREAWFRIYQASQDSNALLNVVRLHNDLGEHQQALKIINRIQLEYLDPDSKAAWYDEMGETYFARQQLNNAAYAQLQAVQTRPAAERWFNYAVTLYQLRQLEDARMAIDQALATEPDNSRFLVRKAQIANASDDPQTARDILAQIARSEPDDYELNATLALAESASGSGTRASAAWERALDALAKDNGTADLSALSVRSRLRSLEHSWYIEAGSSACFTDDTCRELSDSMSSAANSRGYVGVDYQFSKHWRAGVEIEYLNQDNSLAPDDQTMLAAVGFDYLPFEQQNLAISLDRMLARNGEIDDNTRLRLRYDNQGREGQQLPSGLRSQPYLYVGGEISQMLEGDQATFAQLETRLGRQLQRSDSASLTPYVFGQGEYFHSNKNSNSSVESGVGMKLSMEHDFNADGQAGQTDISLRAGRDLVDSDDNEQFRTTLGIDFNY